MKLAFLALLLAFAAPAPFVESTPAVEEELALDSARNSRPSSRDAACRTRGGRSETGTANPRRPAWEVDGSAPSHAWKDWPPRLFSRPPPHA